MAIIDLPQTRGFHAAQFSLGLDVSESTFTGALTGNRQRRSNLADRLRGTLLLPPTTSREVAGQREALLMGLRSGGDWLRMGLPHRPAPLGNLRGAVVVAANAVAGARSIQVSGGVAWPNLLRGGSFESDASGDGVADGWAPYALGTTGTITRALDLSAGNRTHGAAAQRVACTALGPGSGNQAGVFQTASIPPGVFPAMVASVDVMASAGVACEIYVVLVDQANTVVQAVSASVAPGLAFTRLAIPSFPVPPSAVAANFHVYMAQGSSAAAFFVADCARLEAPQGPAAYPGPPRLLAGDFISVGSNLLQVAYGGATLNDAGAGAIPLALPLQRPLVAGAVVNVSAPAGVWELDDEGLQLDYSARNVQAGVAVPLRQVVV